ncbi:hypothetical protein V8E51_004601 [Hyaloscypha variabilis]
MGVWKILDVNDVLHYYADNFNHLATSITASFLVAFVLLLLHGEDREEAANHLLPAYGLTYLSRKTQAAKDDEQSLVHSNDADLWMSEGISDVGFFAIADYGPQVHRGV